MLEFLMLAVGLFVGWNLPQPELAKKLQALITAKLFQKR